LFRLFIYLASGKEFMKIPIICNTDKKTYLVKNRLHDLVKKLTSTQAKLHFYLF
jgi:hypothetical protein